MVEDEGGGSDIVLSFDGVDDGRSELSISWTYLVFPYLSEDSLVLAIKVFEFVQGAAQFEFLFFELFRKMVFDPIHTKSEEEIIRELGFDYNLKRTDSEEQYSIAKEENSGTIEIQHHKSDR